jgi:hypothetical protein
MLKLQGIAVSSGVTIGEALVLDSEGFRIPRRFVARSAVDTELQRLSNAVAESTAEIKKKTVMLFGVNSVSSTLPFLMLIWQCFMINGCRRNSRVQSEIAIGGRNMQ